MSLDLVEARVKELTEGSRITSEEMWELQILQWRLRWDAPLKEMVSYWLYFDTRGSEDRAHNLGKKTEIGWAIQHKYGVSIHDIPAFVKWLGPIYSIPFDLHVEQSLN